MDQNFQQLALDHFEKAVLGAFGVWLVIVLAGFSSPPEIVTANDQLKTGLSTITNYMNNAADVAVETPDWTSTVSSNLSADSVASASAFPDWSAHRRPGFVYNITTTVVTHTPVHRPPVDVDGDAGERGKVILTWKPNPSNKFVIVRYEVLRRIGEDGEFERVEEITSDARRSFTYEDTDLTASTTYYYKVRSRAQINHNDNIVREHGLVLEEDQMVHESSEIGPFTTEEEFRMFPLTVEVVTWNRLVQDSSLSEDDESAYIRVWKFDENTNSWVQKSFQVAKGEFIGGPSRDVDFTTHAILEDVRYTENVGDPDPRDLELEPERGHKVIVVRWPAPGQQPGERPRGRRVEYTDQDAEPED